MDSYIEFRMLRGIKMPGLLGEKIGMTQVFTDAGNWIPVTVIKAGPCTVLEKKLKDTHGYSAVQLGFKDAKRKKTAKKPYAGHFTKKGLKVLEFVREIRSNKAENYTAGDVVGVGSFITGDIVDIEGVSKGKGFQGVIKRHHFAGGMASHGCSVSHRVPGSIGQRTYPGKVFKGKKMPGRMGGEKVTLKNLEVMGVEAEQNLLLVKGAIPGGKNGYVVIYPRKSDFEGRFLKSKTAESAQPSN